MNAWIGMVPPLGRGLFDEDVRGVIVGEVTSTYGFYHKVKRLTDGVIVSEPVCKHEEFTNDDEAIAWFRREHPEVTEFEMRVFD